MNDRTNRLWSRVRQYLDQGNATAARIVLESILQHDPQHTPSFLTLSCLAWEEGRVRDAARFALEAAACPMADPSLQLDVARALVDAGEAQTALRMLRQPLLMQNTDWRVQVNVAGLLRKLGCYEDALALSERAAANGAIGADFLNLQAHLLTAMGRFGDAEKVLDTSISLWRNNAQASLDRSLLRRQTADSNHLEEIERAMLAEDSGSVQRAVLGFAKYKELEDLGRLDEAWAALVAANDILSNLWEYRPESIHGWVARVIDVCTAATLRMPGESLDDGPQPIFVFGMPRSGTTLLDRLLGAHPRVRSVGELDDFPAQLRWLTDSGDALGPKVRARLADLDYDLLGRRYLDHTRWRAEGADFYIDKRPWNQWMAGLIHRALPKARLLRMVREDAALCFSNYRAYLGETFAYSYSLNAFSDYNRQCRRIGAYWHAAMPGVILDVSYSDLVTNTEATMKRVVAHCGLEWNPICLNSTANVTPVATPSAVKVRGPISKDELAGWSLYANKLSGLYG